MPEKKKRALILLSGGIDSATALYWAVREQYDLTALSINFYLRSPSERRGVSILCEHTKTPLIELDLPMIMEAADVVATGITPPYGKNYPEGYVPQRNLVFYAMAAYYAEIHGFDAIIGGHLKSDAATFPDASPDFFHALQQLINVVIPGHSHRVEFIFPLIQLEKYQVISLAFELGVPLESTWSCYLEKGYPCQHCHPCHERAKAFAQAGRSDPLLHRILDL
jgi:7-cyano-7-deazaguanine synthase